MGMKLYGYDNSELMDVAKIYRNNGELMMEGTMLDSLPVVCRLKPADVRQAIRLMSLMDLFFALTMIFRGSR